MQNKVLLVTFSRSMSKLSKRYIRERVHSCPYMYLFSLALWGRRTIISVFLVISIVIDSDKGHCYEHLKKSKYNEN